MASQQWPEVLDRSWNELQDLSGVGLENVLTSVGEQRTRRGGLHACPRAMPPRVVEKVLHEQGGVWIPTLLYPVNHRRHPPKRL